MQQRLYDGDHPDIATSLNNLAVVLRRLGEDERARRLGAEAAAMNARHANRDF